jgi:hypothetical protein
MDRYRSVEILLRLLAFGERLDSYDGNLAGFLTHYMHSASVGASEESVDAVFLDLGTVTTAASIALASATRKLPLMVVEAVLVAAYVHRSTLATREPSSLVKSFDKMMKEPPFAEGARYAVSSVDNVNQRMSAAIAAFAE